MAAVSPIPAPGTLTPPRSPTGAQRTWEPSAQQSSTRPVNVTDSGYLQPSKINTLARKDSEGDSVLDMYGNTSNRSTASVEQQPSSAAPKPSKNVDDLENSSRWIHRDKLARIESRELREAGIHIGPQSRSTSRQMRPRSRSRERTPLDQSMSFDLRLPEEAAADPNEDGGRDTGIHRTPTSKQSFSRIPLSTSSPIPVPQDYIARHTPLQRSGSNGWSGDDDPLAFNRSRSRSHSIDSQVLLSEDPANYSSSPSKRALNPPKIRKLSTNRPPNPKPRSRSTTNRDASSTSRPGTRSGETPPGSSSSRRPEGDPPWLVHSYAPDSRLPPDQQLLPTVAKRLKQQQWEREGKVGSVYDREFNPVALQPDYVGNENGAIKPQLVEAPAGKSDGVDLDWPLKSPKSPGSTGRPGTSGTDHGGYKTMPTISSTPKADPLGGKTLQPIRVEEPPEKEMTEPKARKMCCCVVM